VLFHFSSLQFCRAALFEEAFALVRAFNYLQGARLLDMQLHSPTLDASTATVGTLDFQLRAAVSDVIVHLVESKICAAFQDTANDSVGALTLLVLLKILSYNFVTAFAIWASDGRVLTLGQMLVDVSDLSNLVTILVGTRDRELVHKPSYRNVRLHLAHDPHLAQRTVRGLTDAGLAEQIMTTRRLHSILVDIEAYGTEPAIVGQTARRKVRELVRASFFVIAPFGLDRGF